MQNNIEKYILLGKNGSELIHYRPEYDKALIEPLIEVNTSDITTDSFPLFVGRSQGRSGVDLNACQRAYKKWGSFGPEGDMIQVVGFPVREMTYYYITSIGNLAFHKPALTVDLALFLIDGKGKRFLTIIIRKYPPCEGQQALPGGFREVKGFHFETAIETIIHETKSEIGLTLIPQYEDPSLLPNAQRFDMIVKFPDDVLDPASVKFLHLGNFQTSTEEKLRRGRQAKRVHETSAYAAILEVPLIGKRKLQKLFKAGDDAHRVSLVEVDSNDSVTLAFGHHNKILQQAFLKLKNL